MTHPCVLMLAQTDSRSVLFQFLNITDWIGVVWVSLGLAGQLMFAIRLTVQWLVSEKNRKSVVPEAYWWFSIAGAIMLLVYFIWRKDVVGVLGQAFGFFIYMRNLWFIYHHRPEQELIA